jgi:O-antigen/teichoic acid export membrane protein
MDNRFAANSLITLTRQLTGILAGLAATVMTARMLGTQGQGEFTLLSLLPIMLFNFLNFGIGTSASYYTGRGESDLPALYKTNLLAGLGLGAASAGIGGGLILGFSDRLFTGVPLGYLFAILPVIPLLFVNGLLMSIFQGKEDFREYNASLLLGQVTTLGLTFVLLLPLHAGLPGAVAGYMAGQAASFLYILLRMNRKYGPGLWRGAFSAGLFRKLLAYGIQAHVNNLLVFLNYRVCVLFLGFWADPSTVGVFTIGVTMAEQLWLFSRAVSTVLFARITVLRREAERNGISALASRIVLGVTLICGLALFLAADWLIALLFGNDYGPGALVIRVLLPGVALVAVERVLSSDLSARGYIRSNMNVAIAASAVNLALTAVLVPAYGMTGAALAVSAVYALSFAAKAVLFRRI